MLTDPFGTNKITHRIVRCGIRVHDVVGPGVFESIYSECMQYELREEGLEFEVNRAAPLIYKGVRLKPKLYLDLTVEGLVAVELKSLEMLLAIHSRQLLSQLRLTNLPVGLLINFNVEVLTKGGVRRIINPRYHAAGAQPGAPPVTPDDIAAAVERPPSAGLRPA